MIEDALLKYLGIYPEEIERADAIVEKVCEAYGIDSDSEVWPYVKQDFEENIFGGNLSNGIMYYAFRNLKAALVESGKAFPAKIDWYINGGDTHFYIDGEEQ